MKNSMPQNFIKSIIFMLTLGRLIDIPIDMLFSLSALVAELVDAADSKSVVCTDVGVRVSPRAPNRF